LNLKEEACPNFLELEEEDFPYPTPFWRFNLQAFQALKGKSNPNQEIKNAK
jgi:hypothetical protein